MRPKIQILFCGGTMVMVPNERGVLVPPSSENILSSFLVFEPRLHEIADIELCFIANIDSSDMNAQIWETIAKKIHAKHDQFDGFVVIHGTDTMSYTASAVSFALQNVGKPVVFTGAQIPGDRIDSDARRNLVNAVRLASCDVAEIMVLMGEKILLGVRASKVSHAKLNAFSSVNWPKLGEVGVKMQFFREIRKKIGQKPILQLGFVEEIISLALIPGMPSCFLEKIVESGVKGLILSAFGTGNLPQNCLPCLEKAQDLKLPVIIRTQCQEGATNIGVYESGRRALDFGAIEAYDMSRETTTTKFMWALSRSKNILEVKGIMHQNLVGEIHR